jgi:hypothetical protein
MYVSRNSETRLCNHCCRGRAISISYSQNVLVVVGISMQCACAILSSVDCPARQHVPTLPHKRHDFPKKKNTKSMF